MKHLSQLDYIISTLESLVADLKAFRTRYNRGTELATVAEFEFTFNFIHDICNIANFIKNLKPLIITELQEQNAESPKISKK